MIKPGRVDSYTEGALPRNSPTQIVVNFVFDIWSLRYVLLMSVVFAILCLFYDWYAVEYHQRILLRDLGATDSIVSGLQPED